MSLTNLKKSFTLKVINNGGFRNERNSASKRKVAFTEYATHMASITILADSIIGNWLAILGNNVCGENTRNYS